MATAPTDAPVEQSTWQKAMGLASTVAGDIGTGFSEAPRAIAHGAISAVNNTIGAVNAGGDYLDRKLGGPELFNDKGELSPSWEFGKHRAASIRRPISMPRRASRRACWMVPPSSRSGCSERAKFTKLGGWIGAAVNSGLAGATTMDPSTKRLSNLIQQVPGVTEPRHRLPEAGHGRSELLARLKNGWRTRAWGRQQRACSSGYLAAGHQGWRQGLG